MERSVLGVIPARFASSRFPGKPLVDIGGKSMIRRVYEQASKCTGLSRVVVATDDERIAEHVQGFGGDVIMTSASHNSGTERIGEVITRLEASGNVNYHVIVNIQGDEPLLDPKQIELALEGFNEPEVQITTLRKLITLEEELFNPNVVKVVTSLSGNALYFSRSPIPHFRGVPQQDWMVEGKHFKHIGLYAYRTEILKKLVLLDKTPLEEAESLEQLRWLENGFKIKVISTSIETVAIDTPEDLLKLTNKA